MNKLVFILTFRFWIQLKVANFHTTGSQNKGQKHNSNQRLFHSTPISQGVEILSILCQKLFVYV